MNIQHLLIERFKHAMVAAGADNQCDPLVKLASKPQFGHYQVNGIMAQAKKLGLAPRDFAQMVINHVDLTNIISKSEIAGPGFINLFLADEFIQSSALLILNDKKLGLTLPAQKQRIVIDYSAPNVAKEMHVGHIRSTIIGDASARVLEFIGHHVIRANHIGDWGTQFGMLIAYLEKAENNHADEMDLADLETFYRQAKQHYDADPDFAEKSRQYVVKLQGGDPYCFDLWQKLVNITMTQNMKIYSRLNVTLSLEDTMGESIYNSMLPDIVDDLKNRGIAHISDGATVVFLDEFKNKDGEPMGVIIQKSDGGYLYATTDIACAKYRYESLKADRILYYTDSRQHQHLEQVWAILYKANYVPSTIKLEHHMFGMMLGKGGKPFKTRSGDTIKLNDLLDEAYERAMKLIQAKNPTLTGNELDAVVDAVAIGAVKYADLSKNRTTDYVFDWDNMLSFEGNTAPYLQYAYTRIISIFKKSDLLFAPNTHHFILTDEKERALLVRLLQLDEVVETLSKEGLPHVLCAYLYEIATLFSSFYEHCPINRVDDEAIKMSRLNIAYLTATMLKTGLNLLGIKTVEKM